MIGIIFFILGLIVGSFLNVVIYRLKIAESLVFGLSKCPKCKKKIKWYDNIPIISFILLKARCRNCNEKISWQYPFIEIISGISFFLINYYYFNLEVVSSWFITVYFLIIVSIFLVIFVYDLLYMEIPMILIWIGIGVAILFNLIFDFNSSIFSQNWLDSRIVSGFIAAILAWIFFFSLSYGSKEKWMGMGDAYLAIFLGLVLGIPDTFYALVIGFILGAAVGLSLVIGKKKGMKSQLPLAPFLIAGSIIIILWGNYIVDWHLSLFY